MLHVREHSKLSVMMKLKTQCRSEFCKAAKPWKSSGDELGGHQADGEQRRERPLVAVPGPAQRPGEDSEEEPLDEGEHDVTDDDFARMTECVCQGAFELVPLVRKREVFVRPG